jgi:hypothetical protein
MGKPFIGSEAVAAGAVSNSDLRSRYIRVFRDVYVRGTELTPQVRAKAGWLWSVLIDAGFPRLSRACDPNPDL